MSNLNLATTGKYLKPKERAKLVIAIQIKAYTDDTVETARAQIQQLVNSCPPHHAKEYNFYIDLKQDVWDHIIDDIRDHLIQLEFLSGNLAPFRYLMGISPFLSECINELRRLPVIVTKEAYDEAVVEARNYERAQVLKLDGPYDLAKQEAYYRLTSEKRIEAGEFEGYRDYMDNYGKSKDVLIQEKVASIRKDIEKFELRWKRMGGDESYSSYLKPYIGLSDEEIAAKVSQDRDYSLDIPGADEHGQWVKTVEEERKRLSEAADNGILNRKDSGIEAGSYYDWSDRRQKFAGNTDSNERHWNPLHEDCMEIGFSDGKVVSAALAKDGDWRTIIAATIHNKDSIGFAGDRLGKPRLESTIESLSLVLPFVESEKRFDTEERTISLHHDVHKKLLDDFVTNAQLELQTIANNIGLIKAIEDTYFDGMAIIVPGKKPGLLTVDIMKEEADRVVEEHNSAFKQVITDYNRLCFGLWDYRLEDMDSYMLNSRPIVDDEWVGNEIEKLRTKFF